MLISIDPGKNGGIAIFNDNGELIDTHHLKSFYLTTYNGYSLLNLPELEQLLLSLQGQSDTHYLVVEKQTIMGRDTGKSAITTQTNFGILLGLCHWAEVYIGAKVQLVHPRTWTLYVGDLNLEQTEDISKYPKAIRESNSKQNAIAFVTDRIKTDLPRNRTGNLHDGIIDAIAIGLYTLEEILE